MEPPPRLFSSDVIGHKRKLAEISASPENKEALQMLRSSLAYYFLEPVHQERHVDALHARLACCQPGIKEALIIWIFFKSLGLPHAAPQHLLAWNCREYDCLFFEKLPNSDKVQKLAAAFWAREKQYDIAALVAQFDPLVAHFEFEDYFYDFFFDHLVVKSSFDPRVLRLIDKMAFSTAHETIPFYQRLIRLVRSGNYRIDPANPTSVCQWVERLKAEKGTEAFLRLYEKGVIDEAVWFDRWQDLNAQKPTPLTPDYAIELLYLHSRFSQGSISALSQELIPIVLADPQSRLMGHLFNWLCRHETNYDSLSQIVQLCPVSQFPDLLKAMEQTSEEIRRQFFRRVLNATAEPCGLPRSVFFLGDFIEFAFTLTKGILEPEEREAMIAWVQRIPFDDRLRLFEQLLPFADFPLFWPHFRFSATIKVAPFLAKVARRWPALRLSAEQKLPYPQQYLEDSRVGPVLYAKHFPEVAAIPDLPLVRILETHSSEHLMLLHEACGVPNQLNLLRRDLTRLLEWMDYLIRLNPEEAPWNGLLCFQILVRLFEATTPINPDTFFWFKLFLYNLQTCLGRCPALWVQYECIRLLTDLSRNHPELLAQYPYDLSPLFISAFTGAHTPEKKHILLHAFHELLLLNSSLCQTLIQRPAPLFAFLKEMEGFGASPRLLFAIKAHLRNLHVDAALPFKQIRTRETAGRSLI